MPGGYLRIRFPQFDRFVRSDLWKYSLSQGDFVPLAQGWLAEPTLGRSRTSIEPQRGSISPGVEDRVGKEPRCGSNILLQSSPRVAVWRRQPQADGWNAIGVGEFILADHPVRGNRCAAPAIGMSSLREVIV